MNNLHTHSLAALTYFRSGLVMVLCFSLAVLLQPAGQIVIHKGTLAISLVSAGCYAAFLFLGRAPEGKSESDIKPEDEILDPLALPQRPPFWLLATIEWAIFATSILWFFVISLGIKT